MKIIKIGRGEGNNIIINDSLVSRVHCQIIQDDNGCFCLIDANSRNGTFVNGERRHGEVFLKPTDIIRIGNSTLPWQSYFQGTSQPPKTPDPGAKPDNFMTWAILSTIFCSLLFGIISIVYASKVNSLWYAGRYEEARNAAKKARIWFWVGFAIGLFSIIVNVAIILVQNLG